MGYFDDVGFENVYRDKDPEWEWLHSKVRDRWPTPESLRPVLNHAEARLREGCGWGRDDPEDTYAAETAHRLLEEVALGHHSGDLESAINAEISETLQIQKLFAGKYRGNN
jgi:hypothetical protein